MSNPVLTDSFLGFPGSTQKIREILVANGVTDSVKEIVVEESGLTGKHFGSVTQLVTIVFEDSSREPLNLFVKLKYKSPEQNAMLEKAKLFQKESSFLMEYLPLAKRFCESKGQQELLKIYPKCYFADGTDKIVILENIANQGFVLSEQAPQQDYDAAKLTLESLAKHHAISFAYIHQNGGPAMFVQKFTDLNFEAFSPPHTVPLVDPRIENALMFNLVLLENCQLPGVEIARELLNAHRGTPFVSKILEAVKITSEDKNMTVLNHGDCWNNNMMFRRDSETGKFVDHVLVDFQITRYGNLCLDLQYYIFSSVRPSVRSEKLQDLLKIYLKTLNETSDALESPMNLPFEQLFINFRRKTTFGLYSSMMIRMRNALQHQITVDLKLTQEEAGSPEIIRKWKDEHLSNWQKFADDMIQLAEQYKKLILTE